MTHVRKTVLLGDAIKLAGLQVVISCRSITPHHKVEERQSGQVVCPSVASSIAGYAGCRFIANSSIEYHIEVTTLLPMTRTELDLKLASLYSVPPSGLWVLAIF